MNKRGVIILGGGGHAKVLAEILENENKQIIGICNLSGVEDDQISLKYPVLGGDDVIGDYNASEIILVNAIGSVNIPVTRMNLFKKMKLKEMEFMTVLHKDAIISESIDIREGCQVMAGAIVQASVQLGNNVLLNTGSIIDHDCKIGDHTHIAPGARLSGDVTVGECVHIGTGATVIQGINIGNSVVIGAGVTVLKNVPDNTIVKASVNSVWV